jgi:hypothetical protein
VAGFSEGAGEGLGLAWLVDGSAAEGVVTGGDAWEQGGPVGVGEAERPRDRAAVGVETVCVGGWASGRPLQVVGAGRISASIQFNFVKCGSFSVGRFASGSRLTWTLDDPELPTCAYPETASGVWGVTFRGLPLLARSAGLCGVRLRSEHV